MRDVAPVDSRQDILEASRRACCLATRRHAKSFYFASHTLPPGKRADAYAVYAFCRYVDDRIDLARDADERKSALADCRAVLDEAYRETPPAVRSGLEWIPAFGETARRLRIPRAHFLDLLTGVEMDMGRVRLRNWTELRRYCYHVAGVVGLIMVHVLAEPREDLAAPAIDLGIAMQLTNILRDISEDWQRDRVYLPEDEMAHFGVVIEDLSLGRASESWKALMRFQIGRAREHYERAEAGIRQLPADGSRMTAWTMRYVYAAILNEIERVDYRVFGRRVHVSLLRKLMLAIRAWKRSAGSAS